MPQDSGLEEEQSEGYFASVSDLMVGVLFVFLLMLTIFALNFRDDSSQLDEAIARARAAEQHAERLKAENEKQRAMLADAAKALERESQDREAARADMLKRLAQRLEQANIRFTIDARSGVLRLSDAIPFATGHSDLGDPHARQTLTVLASVLADVLPCYAHGAPRHDCLPGDAPILETVLVEGHTDRQIYANMTQMQSEQENDRLSAARAMTVFTEMRRQQPAIDALQNPEDQPLLGISGYGQRRPLPDAQGTAEADFNRNRRIDLRFVLVARTSDELRPLLDQIAKLVTPAP